jgi:hypothetical protein
MCAGFGLGRVVMMLKVATYLHCFNWESGDPNRPVETDTEHFGVTVVPEDFTLKLTPRPAAKLAPTIEGLDSIIHH